ncbi:MAG: hypothetical protein FD180_1334 [Planctomycetota bacterium]|nr:MAG: hypothetical protein FD180_1334 [Planctomycetota bacterium]
MNTKSRHSSGRIALAMTIVVVATFGVAAWRIRGALQTRRPPASTAQVRGAAIDSPAPAPAGEERLPSTGTPPGDGTARSGHIPANHGGPQAPSIERTPEAEAEYPTVSYNTLASFLYVIPSKRKEGDTSKRPEQIPENLRALNGKQVCVVGYMLPTVWDEDRITEFLLMRNIPQCCFGIAPQVNEWIVVTMEEDTGSPEHKLTPTGVEGVLEVGELEVDGWVQSVYRMKAHSVLQTE